MIRKRILLAAVVTVAVLVCVVPWWSELLLRLTYRERALADGYHHDGWFILEKRYSWLPGPPRLPAERLLCRYCRNNNHKRCAGELILLEPVNHFSNTFSGNSKVWLDEGEGLVECAAGYTICICSICHPERK